LYTDKMMRAQLDRNPCTHEAAGHNGIPHEHIYYPDRELGRHRADGCLSG